FSTDGDGILVDYEGRKVLGWVADYSGVLPTDRTGDNLTPLSIQIGSNMPAKATKNLQWIKNLDANSDVGATKQSAVTVYDSLGSTHTILMKFEKTSNTNEWSWTATYGNNQIGTGVIKFNPDGTLLSPTAGATLTLDPTGGASQGQAITMDFSNLTQVAGPTTVESGAVDGWPTGTLESFSFDSSGVVSGFYSNGKNLVLGQIALANFRNPSGLIKLGNSLFIESNNSGRVEIGPAGTSGRGTVAPAALEMSNVDLAEEFTQMIITQRGFQANSRVITVSDELLQELVNLKR
ncbi:MAG TPA: flagellar hook-basal body complex protein, partial [Bacillota bacterium]|nr:flagellar hook-basal body complex protein [Bacillota bacterium]